jgi:hypothetical protein
MFYVDRPNLIGLNAIEGEKIIRQCVLSENDWRDMKNIFDTLDTFGN